MPENTEASPTGSGSTTCSVPSPPSRVIWKWWIWNKVSESWMRCEGTPDYDSEDEARERSIIFRRDEEVPVLMREGTDYSAQNADVLAPTPQETPSSRLLQPRLVRLIRFIKDVWQSPDDIEMVREAHRKASERYERAVQHYHQCEEDQVNSLMARNDASYWKGRRDSLRHLIHFMPNTEIGRHPQTQQDNDTLDTKR